jgi:DNA-binding response OmpR family regulator
MQKVLIAQDLKPLLMQSDGPLNREGITVFAAATNDEVLKTHIEEIVNLIVTRPDLPGTSIENIFDIIWQSESLRVVSLLMVCEDNSIQKKRCKNCGAETILVEPLDPALLQEKVRKFLDVSPRKAYRVVLNVSAEGKFRNHLFSCHTENISSAGMLIGTEIDLALGDRISFSYFLPDETKVVANGEVVRVIKTGDESKEKLYGIRYTTIASDVREKIETYVRRARTDNFAAAPDPKS